MKKFKMKQVNLNQNIPMKAMHYEWEYYGGKVRGNKEPKDKW